MPLKATLHILYILYTMHVHGVLVSQHRSIYSVKYVVLTVAESPSSSTRIAIPAVLNPKSHAPRLGLARALSRSAETQQEACSLYQEVISMAPKVSLFGLGTI